jgi:hypothetical protein
MLCSLRNSVLRSRMTPAFSLAVVASLARDRALVTQAAHFSWAVLLEMVHSALEVLFLTLQLSYREHGMLDRLLTVGVVLCQLAKSWLGVDIRCRQWLSHSSSGCIKELEHAQKKKSTESCLDKIV